MLVYVFMQFSHLHQCGRIQIVKKSVIWMQQTESDRCFSIITRHTLPKNNNTVFHGAAFSFEDSIHLPWHKQWHIPYAVLQMPQYVYVYSVDASPHVNSESVQLETRDVMI